MKVLNLYAGLGGNRKKWEGCEVVAVEANEKIAAVYRQQNPGDELVTGDAHQYLLDNYASFDFIWSSPPCQTHSRMNKATRHKTRRYPSMDIYQEIIFLQHFYTGLWVVENVAPYYEFLIEPTAKVGRHMFWSNFEIQANDVARPSDFINLSSLKGRNKLMDWLGIHYEKSIYYAGNHCPAQVLRNCVHPDLGKQIFDCALDRIPRTEQLDLLQGAV